MIGFLGLHSTHEIGFSYTALRFEHSQSSALLCLHSPHEIGVLYTGPSFFCPTAFFPVPGERLVFSLRCFFPTAFFAPLQAKVFFCFPCGLLFSNGLLVFFRRLFFSTSTVEGLEGETLCLFCSDHFFPLCGQRSGKGKKKMVT